MMPAKSENTPFRPVTVVIPTFGAAEKLAPCLASLARGLDPATAVFVIDDTTPDDSVPRVCEAAMASLPGLRYVRNQSNLGFVGSCNRGWSEFADPESDLLLLNSDTEVTEGFLLEMQQVMYAHDRHAAVSPRSNDASLCTVPIGSQRSPEEAWALWKAIRDLLPRYTVAPTAVGFCLLIRNSVLRRFGLFDEAYSPGYNEENDFICRVNRYGFSAVLANRAFVFHHSGASFGSKRSRFESRNGKLLRSRYPEYQRSVADYFRYGTDPADEFATVFEPHRPRVLYDLTHLETHHCGTSQAALKILRHLAPRLEPDLDIHIEINEAAFQFFADELAGYKRYDERLAGFRVFDAALKPCQIFKWEEFGRLNRRAPRICLTLLDIIAVRCGYLSAPSRQIIVGKTAELADRVFPISRYSRQDFEAYYGCACRIDVIELGSDPRSSTSNHAGDYVLLVGGRFDHKALKPAIEALKGVGKVLVLGGVPDEFVSAEIEPAAVGTLSRSDVRRLYRNASVVVYPSQYEGFGLPLPEASQYHKPVIVFDDSVMHEVAGLLPSADIRFVRSFADLAAEVERARRNSRPAEEGQGPDRSWDDVAAEYEAALRALLESPIDWERVRRRWETARLLDSVGAC